MAARRAKCPSCGQGFEPKRSTAVYCSSTCRQRARRKRAAAKTKAPVKKAAAPKRTEAGQTSTSAADNHKLVVALRQELEDAGALDTFEGQLALELARRLVNPDSSASALADKVRAARAAALGQKSDPAEAGDGEPDEPEDDEVTRARKQREESRKAAGLT